jgi:hypothetical protein
MLQDDELARRQVVFLLGTVRRRLGIGAISYDACANVDWVPYFGPWGWHSPDLRGGDFARDFARRTANGGCSSLQAGASDDPSTIARRAKPGQECPPVDEDS